MPANFGTGTLATNVLVAVTPAIFVAFRARVSAAAVTLAWPTRRRAEAAPRETLSRRGQAVGPSGVPNMRAQTFRLAARIPRPRRGRADLPPDRARPSKAADFPSRCRRGSVRAWSHCRLLATFAETTRRCWVLA